MSGRYPLPNAHAAFVADEKIRDYLLDPLHPGNSGKAGFYTSFGFSLRDWPKLADALRPHAGLHRLPGAGDAERADPPQDTGTRRAGSVTVMEGTAASVKRLVELT